MLSFLAPAVILLGATAAQEAAPEPVPGAPAQQDGTFAIQAEAGDTPPVSADPAAEQRRLESLFEGALVGTRDAEDFVETPGYRRLLETLERYSEDDLRARAGRRLDVPAALADPRAWRGEIVRVRALLVDLDYIRLANPLVGHVDAVRALLTEGDGSEGIFVDFLVPPEADLRREFELERDVVEVEGVFLRTVRYENRKGAFVEAPQLIARGLRKLDTEQLPRSTGFDQMAKILIALAVAFLVIRILTTMKKGPLGRQRSGQSEAPGVRGLRDRARAPAPKH